MKKALLLALLLAGCQSISEHYAEADDRACQSYGATFGSPAYVQCRQSREQDRRAFAEQVARNNRASVADSPPQITRPTINCTTLGMGGGFSSTSCQ